MRLSCLIFVCAALCAQEQTHVSQVLDGPRTYRVYRPAGYASAPQKRFPVIYWLHGYDAGSDARAAEIAAWTAKHDAIVVDSGPVELSGNYPLYLPELAAQIDRTLRTIADRGHRAVSGLGTGGFLALWLAGKSPDLVSSASGIAPVRSGLIGPRGFEVDTVLDDLRPDYQVVRTRLFNTGTVSEALDFHMTAFGAPAPPPRTFDHADPYPNFSLWGWTVVSNRRRPGVTLLDDVSGNGFRSAVREWAPGGAEIPEVKLSIESPPLYPPRSPHTITYIRLSDGKVRRETRRAGADGRLTFELDGGAYDVGIGAGPILTLARFELVDAPWAVVGTPVKLRLTIWNKGGANSPVTALTWQSSSVGVKFNPPVARLPVLHPGESLVVPLTFTAASALAGTVRIAAAGLAVEVPVYPQAAPAEAFTIVDEGDAEGHASPGESFVVKMPDGLAELITNDRCVDTSIRSVENGMRYTHASIRASCEPGTTVRMLARTPTSYRLVSFPIWYKLP